LRVSGRERERERERVMDNVKYFKEEKVVLSGREGRE
jgi:hypothetical protein